VVGRKDGGAGNRLAVYQLQLVRGLLQRLRGRVYGGRAKYTTGHGVRYARQRGPDRRPLYGHHARDRLQPAGHVQTCVDGIVFGRLLDDRQGGKHVRQRQRQRQQQFHRQPGRHGWYNGRPSGIAAAAPSGRRVHVHRGGHGRHSDGRPHTDTYVRVSAGRRVHDTVRDAGQRVHGRSGCPRGHFPDEGAAGRQDR